MWTTTRFHSYTISGDLWKLIDWRKQPTRWSYHQRWSWDLGYWQAKLKWSVFWLTTHPMTSVLSWLHYYVVGGKYTARIPGNIAAGDYVSVPIKLYCNDHIILIDYYEYIAFEIWDYRSSRCRQPGWCSSKFNLAIQFHIVRVVLLIANEVLHWMCPDRSHWRWFCISSHSEDPRYVEP